MRARLGVGETGAGGTGGSRHHAGEDHLRLGCLLCSVDTGEPEGGSLQNGERFRGLVASEARSPLTTSLAAEVATVTLTSTTTAAVTYSLTIGGKPALEKLKGEAVLQKGTWKVGDRSFCSLISLEGVSPPGCPGPSTGA